MLSLNHRPSSSSPSSCNSPPQIFSPRKFENESLQNILNPSEGLSSYNKPGSCFGSQIVQLERRLLDTASNGNRAEKFNNSGLLSSMQSPDDLRDEITRVEIEILRLERYILTLYRTAFEGRISSVSNITETDFSSSQVKHEGLSYGNLVSPVRAAQMSNVPSLSTCLKTSSMKDMTGYGSGKHRRLGDLLGASQIIENVVTPNGLSEEIVRCISSIYCKLSNSHKSSFGFPASSSSPSSDYTSSVFSPKTPRRNDIPEHETWPDITVVEALKIHLDDDIFNHAALMLQNFRLMVQNLEKVDPTKMKREEKLAFWINIHNALVMHAYLAYGTHNRARNSSVLKAAYNIGGRCINAYLIQGSILGIRPHHSAPMLQTLFSPGRKSKTCSIKHVYALDYPEPLVHFALCSGASADPSVCVYRADSIFQDLRKIKEEFIKSNVLIHKGTKIRLPKAVYYYMKDMPVKTSDLAEVITGLFPEAEKKSVRKTLKEMKNKHVEWLPENSNFRYVIRRGSAGGK